MRVRWSPILFILALSTGCQSTTPSPSEGASAENPEVVTAEKGKSTFSGFLGDYSQLQPAPDREGVLLFIDRSADYRPYSKVMFDPMQFYVTPNPDYPEVPRDELVRMGESLQRSFQQALVPAYQVVSQPGPDVLRVRTAITGIQPAKPAMGVTDYIPIKAIFNIGREAAGGGGPCRRDGGGNRGSGSKRQACCRRDRDPQGRPASGAGRSDHLERSAAHQRLLGEELSAAAGRTAGCQPSRLTSVME